MEDPQVRAREMVATLKHPALGRLPTTGIPVKLAATPGAIRTAPPLLGQHTERMLSELLRYPAEQIGASARPA